MNKGQKSEPSFVKRVTPTWWLLSKSKNLMLELGYFYVLWGVLVDFLI